MQNNENENTLLDLIERAERMEKLAEAEVEYHRLQIRLLEESLNKNKKTRASEMNRVRGLFNFIKLKSSEKQKKS